MTETPEEQAGGTIAFAFSQPNPVTWFGTATCPHGVTRNTTYLIGPGVPPLNHNFMVDNVYRQHELLMSGCDCTRTRPKQVGTVTFQLPIAAVPPGQQRYVPQASATLSSSNLWWGPGLTVAKAGAYSIQASVQLGKSVALGAGGYGVLLLSGQPVLSVKMFDSGGYATASISTNLNISANQSIALGYENTSAAPQDVTTATFAISEIWVP